jgi:hypothetical protein
MHGKIPFVTILSIMLTLVFTADLHAEWKPDGVSIASTYESQEDIVIIADGEGGAFIAWEDQRTGVYFDIYMQRIDSYGNPLWADNGVAVRSSTNSSYRPSLALDGAGGVIVTWEDNRGSDSDIYAQRLNGSGVAQWTANGIVICNATNHQYYPEIIADGSGGAIITWMDLRLGGSNYNIHAQRVDQNGTIYWQVNGNTICWATDQQRNPVICADGLGGAIIAWDDMRNSSVPDIYAQRILIDGSGTPTWTSNGVAICSASDWQQNPEIMADGDGGAFIAWEDARGMIPWDIYVQRVNNSGIVQWTSNGVCVCDEANSQRYPKFASDGQQGLIVTWQDERTSFINDIYAQRVDAGGYPLWLTDGVPVCLAADFQWYPTIAPDGMGGAIIAWSDERSTTELDIYMQHLDGDGVALWAEDGLAVCTASSNQDKVKIAADGTGGMILAWQDKRHSTYSDIYAQRIEPIYGYWGFPEPRINDVSDVPEDQGGTVNLSWFASQHDDRYMQDITHYSIWRALDAIPALSPQTESLDPLKTDFIESIGPIVMASDISEDFDGPAVRIIQMATSSYFWEWIGNIDAHYLDGYMLAAPTLNDSTGSEDGMHFFLVSAHTSDPFVFWDSQPDSGYSVDNLSPCPPAAVMAEQIYTPEGLEITWEPSTEPDLHTYVIHRGLSSDFVPDEGNLIYDECEAVYFDGDWRWDSGYWYKVAAVDVHGNVSEYVLLGPEGVTGEETPETPAASYLSQNYPNPFNPLTMIRFGLEEPGRVSLRIYDTAGRLVRMLIDEARDAGHYAEEWDGRDSAGRTVASGVYFYRVEAGEYTETKKMVLLR